MDNLEALLLTLIQQVLKTHVWGSSATVQDYDPGTHKVKVVLQPSGEQTDYLPIMTAAPGLADTITSGMPCYVHMEYGVPVAVSGVHFNDNTPVPTASMVLSGAAHILGDLQLHGGSLTLGPVSSLPTPTPDMRGKFAFLSTAIDGYSGTADALYLCCQSATGSLSWKLLVSG